jgi:predicted small secreted protein
MKKLLQLTTFGLALALFSCEYINSKILNSSIEGVYENAEGTRMEFTESKVTYQDIASFSYKVEGKYLYVEDFGIGELKFGDMRYEILDPNTIKLAGGIAPSKNEDEIVFRKVEE